jgi:hypothetical protein
MIKPNETMPTVVRVLGMLSASLFMGLIGMFGGVPFSFTVHLIFNLAGAIFGLFISAVLLNILDCLFYLIQKEK